MAYAQQFAYPVHDQHNNTHIQQRSALYHYDTSEGSSVLDPAALSEPNTNTTMSPGQHPHYRRDSFTNSTGVLSPAESASNWDHKLHAPGLGIEHAASLPPSNPFHHDNDAFVSREAPHNSATYAAHAWNFDQHSGTCTPTGFDVFPSTHDFEHAQYPHGVPEPSHPTYPTFTPVQRDPGYVPAPQVNTPMSPHSHTDWMAMAEAESKSRAMPQRMRSPPRTYADFQKRDGIRKKNARVDIPPERSLETIERLIGQTTNEDEIKELKAQKRLLRNREAALASRQRKKKHTEELEIKEKGYTAQISMLEKELNDVHLRCEAYEREKQMLSHHQQEAQQTIRNLHFEKEELVLKHAEETGNLRRKIQYLTEQLEAGPAPAMSAAPSSTGFTDFTSEMDALNMGRDDWDNLFIVNGPHDSLPEFDWDNSNWTKVQSSQTIAATTHSTEPIKPAQRTAEPPIASGILFMLLLCGAFVASKGSASSAAVIPKMPEEVRAASTTVLDTLLRDAKTDMVPDMTRKSAHTIRANAESAPSNTLWHAPKGNNDNHLDSLHHHFATPSKEQEAEQLFSLTPAQYNSLTNPSYPNNDSAPKHNHAGPSSHRRNLAQTLANMREESLAKGGAAEVYTRSLLWDQIPADVVRQFKELVQESQQKTSTSSSSDGSGDVDEDRKDAFLDHTNSGPFGYTISPARARH